MELLWSQMRIAAEHLPIFMPRDHCDRLDGEACLNETAGAFVTQVVEVQILDS
jgi:hypothetical protein